MCFSLLCQARIQPATAERPRAKPSSAKETILDLTCKWITLANRHYYMYLGKALAPLGINTSQYLFILALCREPGITQDKLPERISINKSNVTRALTQLERAGFIRRESNPHDKRTTTVHPTQRAYDLYPQIMRVVAHWDAAVTSRFSGQEKETLQTLLQRLTDAAKAFKDDAMTGDPQR